MSIIWNMKPLKRVCDINRDTLREDTPSDWEMIYLDISAVDSEGNIAGMEPHTFASAPTRARRRVQAGNTVISTVRTYLKAIAFFDNPPDNLIASTGFAVLTSNAEMDPRFLWRWIQSHDFVSQIVANSEGAGYPAIAPSKLANLPVSYPLRDGQIRIADYLEEKIKKIDHLIALRRRQKELLSERRAAYIQQTVTRGLNTEAKLKDSEISWLGEIPVHWKIKRMKFLTKDAIAYGANETGLGDDPSKPRFLRITDIDSEGQLRSGDFQTLEQSLAEPYLLQDGDILFARSGATIGKAFLYDAQSGAACYASYLVRFRCDQNQILPKFLANFTQTPIYWYQIHKYAIKTTIENFSAEKYANIIIVVPPVPEQQTIINHIQQEDRKYDSLISAYDRQIAILAEYRIALINECVTGKKVVDENVVLKR